MKYGWLIYDSYGIKRNEWFINRLISCAKNEGILLDLICTDDIFFGVKDSKPYIDVNKKSKPDFAIVRTINPLLTKVLESCGIRVFNSAKVSGLCNDKRQTQLLSSILGIPTADTFFHDKRFSSSYPDFPFILKSASGHGGGEVFYINSNDELKTNLEKITQNEYLTQAPKVFGKDMRVYMLKNEFMCAVLRTSNTSFKSNFTSGGNAESVTPSEEIIKYSKKITEYLNSDFVGVDFIFDSNSNPLLNEVEDVVGTRMIYALTDIDICARYINYIKNQI